MKTSSSLSRVFLLAFVLLSTAFCSSTYADTIQYEGIVYNIKANSTLEVASYQNKSLTGAIVIPETITANNTTYTITSVSFYAFYDCSSLTSVTLPNSVTSIGAYAFNDCDNITNITLPNSLTSIRVNTFAHCYSLTSVTIPNSVTSIGDYAFYYCSSLTTPNTYR